MKMERLEGAATLLCYALAAISGGLGGCAVTAHSFIANGGNGNVSMRASWLAAYAIVGSVFGLLTAIYGFAFLDIKQYTDIVGPSLISGIVGATSLSCVNMTARFVLKRLGIEVIVTVKKEAKRGVKP